MSLVSDSLPPASSQRFTDFNVLIHVSACTFAGRVCLKTCFIGATNAVKTQTTTKQLVSQSTLVSFTHPNAFTMNYRHHFALTNRGSAESEVVTSNLRAKKAVIHCRCCFPSSMASVDNPPTHEIQPNWLVCMNHTVETRLLYPQTFTTDEKLGFTDMSRIKNR